MALPGASRALRLDSTKCRKVRVPVEELELSECNGTKKAQLIGNRSRRGFAQEHVLVNKALPVFGTSYYL